MARQRVTILCPSSVSPLRLTADEGIEPIRLVANVLKGSVGGGCSTLAYTMAQVYVR